MSRAVHNQRVTLRLLPGQVWNYSAQLAIVFAAYFVAGKLGQATVNIRSGNLGPVWPAYGVALAATLLWGSRTWVAIAVAAFLVAYLSPVPLATAVGQAAGSTLAALAGAFLLGRVAKFQPTLGRLRDALALIVFGAMGSAMVSASIGVSVLYATHMQAYSGLGSAWLIYWLGDATGVLLVTPLLMTAPKLLGIRPWSRILEFAELLLLLTIVCFIIFGDLPLIPIKLHVLAFAVLPFVMWAAIRFGVSGTALSVLFVGSIATVETSLGSGPFVHRSPFTNAVLLDIFFAVLAVSGLTLASVIAEREQAEKEREQLVREQAAMAARLRLGAIVESSDDAIIGQDMDGIIREWNQGAERLYGYAANEAIGQPICLLFPPDHAGDVAEILRKHATVNHLETVHQGKHGTRTEVSMTISPIRDTAGRIVGESVICRDIGERKRQEAVLRKSEERFRLAAEAGKMYAFEWDVASDLVTRSEEHVHILSGKDFGSREIPRTRQELVARVHPDDRVLFISSIDQLTTQIPTDRMRFRLLRPDGSVVWLETSARAFFDEQGRMLRVIGMVADITERKRAEEALATVSRRLLEAQEQERHRIARELHDDISQRLALLAIEIQQVQQKCSELPAAVRNRIDEMERRTSEILTDIQSLSHELHSSQLQHLGLVAAVRDFCEEFGGRQNVSIDFQSHDVPNRLPPDISLCLFRVVQEALHNAAKHSAVRNFEVRIWGTSEDVRLAVRDPGRGFDVKAANKRGGLGLISMEERLKLLNGTFAIESQPGRGTTIHARVRLRAASGRPDGEDAEYSKSA